MNVWVTTITDECLEALAGARNVVKRIIYPVLWGLSNKDWENKYVNHPFEPETGDLVLPKLRP